MVQLPSFLTEKEKRASAAIPELKAFIGRAQLLTIARNRLEEEGEFFQDKLIEFADRIRTMPKTYEQDGAKDPVAYLHYFAGGQASWWITEKDKETPEEPGQHQAFGLADLFQNGGEMGYISIVELLENGAELDLFFEPTPLSAIRQELAA